MLGFLHLLGRQLVTLSLIGAFVLLGFAHDDIPTPLSPELRAFIAAGGSIDDICGGEHDPEHEEALGCEACRIADSFAILRDCKQAAPVELDITQSWRFIAKRISESQELDPARLTRGPPHV